MRRNFLAAGLALATTTLLACSKPPEKKAPPAPPPAPPPPPPETVTVRIETAKGPIVLRLEAKKAPITTANFLRYLDAKKLNGAYFWRAMKGYKGSGFIQASAIGLKYPPIQHESTKQTGLTHTNGAISMGRYDLNTATNEFVICVGDMTYMDAGRDPKGDNQGYAAFGYVIEGMDVVKSILHGKIRKEKVQGGWDGQMLAEQVLINSAVRVSETAAPVAASASAS